MQVFYFKKNRGKKMDTVHVLTDFLCQKKDKIKDYFTAQNICNAHQIDTSKILNKSIKLFVLRNNLRLSDYLPDRTPENFARIILKNMKVSELSYESIANFFKENQYPVMPKKLQLTLDFLAKKTGKDLRSEEQKMQDVVDFLRQMWVLNNDDVIRKFANLDCKNKYFLEKMLFFMDEENNVLGDKNIFHRRLSTLKTALYEICKIKHAQRDN